MPTTTSKSLRCERCGAALTGVGGPGGAMCPACLMALADSAAFHAAGASDLLAGESTWESFPSTDHPTAPPSSAAAGPPHPEQIGPYRIVERVGEGGMGLVYRAEQLEPIRRTVAVKVLKLGLDSREVVARFGAERQALALMNHPNVAKVFDAGVTVEGRPYFVMEYVQGEAITAYCDRHRLTTRQRLELFVQACEGVQHAHQKGIIHRDLKPSNLLVTVEDGKPLVKVIDFGVAKAMTQRLTDYTLVTERGRLVGTLEYMSPEQVEMGGGEDVDTRTDVYGLGVMLYQLLTAALPFASDTLRSAPFDELRRIIREQEPPRPSTRLDTLGNAARRAAVHRATNWHTLRRELRSELEWIPLKAMRKERAERYRSAAELADDIGNYLEGRPLIAGPQTTAYRVRKFVRKHRRGVSAAAAVAVALVGLIVALAIATGKARWALQQVEQKSEEARRADFRAGDETAQKLVTFGDDLLRTGHLPDARRSYGLAAETADRIHLADAPILSRMFAAAEDAPLVGSLGRDGGVGGFAGGGHANCLALFHDGRRVVTAEQATAGQPVNTIRCWDLLTGAQLCTYGRQGQGTTFVDVSPDDSLVVSASYDGLVRLWRGPTEFPAGVYSGHLQPGANRRPAVYVAKFCPPAFWPSGLAVLSGDADGFLKLWRVADPENPTEVASVKAHESSITDVAFAQDGRTVLTAGKDHVIGQWQLSGGELRRLGELGGDGHDGEVNGVAISLDGTKAVSGGFDGKVLLWDLWHPDAPARLVGRHRGRVWRVAFSPDGRTVASGGNVDSLRLWEVDRRPDQGEPVPFRTFPGHTGEVLGIAFALDGRTLVASGDDSTVRVWDLTDPNTINGVSPSGGAATAAAVSNDGLILLGTASGDVLVCDAETRRVLKSWKAHGGPVRALAVSAEGDAALSSGEDGTLAQWDLAAGALTHRMAYAQQPAAAKPAAAKPAAHAIAFLGGRREAASAGTDGELRIWDLERGRTARAFPAAGEVTAMAAAGDGRAVLTGARDGTVRLWNVGDGSFGPCAGGANGPVLSVAFSPDGQTAFFLGPTGVPSAWNLKSGAVQTGATNPKPAQTVTAAALLPASNAAWASAWLGDADGAMRLVARRDGEPLWRGAAHRGRVKLVAVSPDGRRGVSIGADGTDKVWDFARAARASGLDAKAAAIRARADGASGGRELATALGRWYAARGRYDWAATVLREAGAGAGDAAPVPALVMARDAWDRGDAKRAVSMFALARQRGDISETYFRLCTASLAAGAAHDAVPATTRGSTAQP
jgi:eukaryotic-like serine/threonine-protein kinase